MRYGAKWSNFLSVICALVYIGALLQSAHYYIRASVQLLQLLHWAHCKGWMKLFGSSYFLHQHRKVALAAQSTQHGWEEQSVKGTGRQEVPRGARTKNFFARVSLVWVVLPFFFSFWATRGTFVAQNHVSQTILHISYAHCICCRSYLDVPLISVSFDLSCFQMMLIICH